ALRALFRKEGAGALAPYVPAACLSLYQEAQENGLYNDEKASSTAILARLRGLPPRQLGRVRGVGEGLEHRLHRCVQTCVTLPELYDALKTKRHAHARLRRLV